MHRTESRAPPALRWDDLGSADQALFLREVDAAIARRDGWLAARRALWLEWLVTGGTGLLGLALLGWSATGAALLLLAAFWLGWIVDVVQWLMRSAAIGRSQARESDDERIWQVAGVLRGTRRRLPDARGHPPFGLSLAIDTVAGAAATALLLRGLEAAGAGWAAAVATRSWQLALATIAIATGPLLLARLARDAGGGVALAPFRIGQRGLGLLVLVFALMAAGGGALAPRVLLYVAYGFYVAMALVELGRGLPAARAEAAWLRRQRAAAATAQPGIE